MNRRPESQVKGADDVLSEWSRLSAAARRPNPSFAEPRGGAARRLAGGALVLLVAGVIVGLLLARPEQPSGPAAVSTPSVSAGSPGPSSDASPSSSPDPTPDGSHSIPETPAPTTPTPAAASGTPTTIGSGEWRMLPDAPIQDGRRPTAVWTGEEFIVWGTAGLTDGAAYDPGT